jgi:quinol monooxygenase YgiN
MSWKWCLFAGASIVCASLLSASPQAPAQEREARVVRLAELEIDADQIEQYKVALKEEIETSIRVEPGVLALYAVSVKDNPTQIRLFEMYASPATYQSHLQTPHFKRYKATTQGMMKSLRLLETDPIELGAKTN